MPRDQLFGQQWGFHNTGQEFYCFAWIFGDFCFYQGTPDADIDAPEAWAVSTGSPTITVAVIDTGIDYTHPDLASHFAGATTSCIPPSIRSTITATGPTWPARLRRVSRT